MHTMIRMVAVVAFLSMAGCREDPSADPDTATGSSSPSSSHRGSTGSAGVSAGGMSSTAKSTASAFAGAEVTTPSGLRYQTLVEGTGAVATRGRVVSVHYTGWLTDGARFESSLDSGRPIEFPLGTPNIIRGWNEGLEGMRVGGKRRLTIPPDLGYGPTGRAPSIPPNATLIFEVELIGVN